MNPSSPKDVYFYLSDSGPALAAMKVVQEAVKYLGVPYVWAGASTSGFDCSGFTMYVYNKFTAQTGVTLPHKSTYQANYGTPVDKDDLLPGDLVFFNSPISHVGMYVGNGLMINSPRSGDLVTIEDVYRSDYATARRLISPYTRVEQTSTLLAYTGAWSTGSTSSASGGSYRYSDSAGFSVTVTFNGVYLQWIAKKSSLYGQASVSVDGKAPETVDLYSASAAYKQKVWDTGLLPSGTHTVTITRTGNKNAAATAANVSVDAFDVIGTVVKAQTVPTPTRSEQTDTRLSFTGSWGTGLSSGASGGSWGYANTSGVSVTVKFTGTSIGWITVKSPNYGIAQVTLDGDAPVTVDLYSPDTKWQQKVWSATGLTDGAHTLTIAYTGTKNAAAAAAYIGVDAFDVLGTLTQAGGPPPPPPPPPAPTRSEQTDTHLAYTGSWGTGQSSGASGGSWGYANTSGACSDGEVHRDLAQLDHGQEPQLRHRPSDPRQ